MNTKEPNNIKIRIIYFLHDYKQAYHLCSVKYFKKDNSIYIFDSANSSVVEQLGIDMINGKPTVTYREVKDIPPLHASYHINSGLKHIREDKGKHYAIFNTQRFNEKDKFFEPILRIFPTYPSSFPFVKQLKDSDYVVNWNEVGEKPIGIIFHATNYETSTITIEAPEHTTVGYISLGSSINLIITTFPASIDDIPLNDYLPHTL